MSTATKALHNRIALAFDFGVGQRVENLARVDYREGSELLYSLTLAVEMLCKQIVLRRQSQGE
jgi:hypothetical protein